MAFSSVWVAVMTILHGLGIINLSVSEIIMSGVGITGVWTPAFVSVITDKIAKKVSED